MKKNLKDKYEADLKDLQSTYDIAKPAADQEVEAERQKLEQGRVEVTDKVGKAKKTLGHISKVSIGQGQEPCLPPGAVNVPTMPGQIIHSNDISKQDMQAAFAGSELWGSLNQEQIAAITAELAQRAMNLLEVKSAIVARLSASAAS